MKSKQKKKEDIPEESAERLNQLKLRYPPLAASSGRLKEIKKKMDMRRKIIENMCNRVHEEI